MRVLALDYGSARTGVAVSDPTGTVARPLEVVERARSDAGVARILELAKEEDVERIVVGLPVTLRGERGLQAQETERFVERLRAATDLPVESFDERFTMAWREDSDLYFTLLEGGGRFAYAADAVVIHPVRAAPWGVSLREQRKSRFNALLFRKHPRLYRERIQPGPPWRYYGTAGALVAAVALAVRGRRMAGAMAGAAWLLQTAAFCRRRLRGTARTPGHVAEMIVTSAVIPPLSVFWRLAGAVRYRVWFP